MRYDDWYQARRDWRSPRGYAGFERAREWLEREDAREPFRHPGGDGHLDSGRFGPARYGLGPYHERLLRRRKDDDELREEVKEALFYDTWVNADAITVEVEDGIVTLRGELPDYDEVRYAADDAWDVEGVIGVRCELHVDEG